MKHLLNHVKAIRRLGWCIAAKSVSDHRQQKDESPSPMLTIDALLDRINKGISTPFASTVRSSPILKIFCAP
jgi:hypothetical protein